MIVKLRVGATCFFLFVCCLTFGQDYFANTRNITTEEGLSHYKVLAFYPELDGMWIGTQDGLNFYDGNSWKYWTKESGQLLNKTIGYIYKGQDDLLWLFGINSNLRKRKIQTIDILNSKRDSVFSFEQKFGNLAPFELDQVQCFFEDQQHRLYFFANNRLWRTTSNHLFEEQTLPLGFEPKSVFSDGTYAGKLNEKLVLVSPDGVLLYTTDYSLTREYYEVQGNRQKFWVSQKNDLAIGFEKRPDGTYHSDPLSVQASFKKNISLLYFDEQQNQLWVRKPPYTYLFDRNGEILYQHLFAPSVVTKDYSGNLWMARNEIDILKLQKKRFKRYLYTEPQQTLKTTSFYHCRGITERANKLYVNTYRGTKIIDLKTKEISTPYEKNLRWFVTLKNRQEKIILANRTLFELDDQDVPVSILKEGHRIEKRSWSMFEDRNGRIWIGSLGLSYLEDGKIKTFDGYNEFESLKEAVLLFFYKDKNGIIWLGGDKGLYQLDLEKGIIAAYGKNEKGDFRLPSAKIQHMHQDAQGVFWLTTEDVGLIRWNKANANIQTFGKKEGMLTNNIYSVYEDDYGSLWMSSFNGLIRFHKESKSMTIYNEEEGLTHNEFNRIAHYQTEDGTLYFGGQNGVTGFHPKDFQGEKSKEELFELKINHISVFGAGTLKDTLSDGSKIDLMDLNPGARVIDLELTGSDLFWNGAIQFHYILNPLTGYRKAGPDVEEKISSTNHIQLFDMQPGRYNLQVRAIQRNGKQLGTTMNIEMKIATPIFHRPVFWIFALITWGIGIWSVIKVRTARMHRRQVELEEMVTERTQQILKDQKVIQTQAEQIEEMKIHLNRKDERWLGQFKEIIKERLDDPDLYLPDIIADMEISRSVFYEKVKTLTKMTPNQYIQEIRLTKAKAILDEGKVKTVKEVAFAIGIKRPSYFSKLFKERFGIMPSAYFRDRSN